MTRGNLRGFGSFSEVDREVDLVLTTPATRRWDRADLAERHSIMDQLRDLFRDRLGATVLRIYAKRGREFPLLATEQIRT